jgi:hypothetical protein
MVPLPFQFLFSQFLLPNKQRAILVQSARRLPSACQLEVESDCISFSWIATLNFRVIWQMDRGRATHRFQYVSWCRTPAMHVCTGHRDCASSNGQ